MKRYRKKPVEVTAVQFDGENFDEVAELFGGRWEPELNRIATDVNEWFSMASRFGDKQSLTVTTMNGPVTAYPGDWIVKGVAGEFYPCDAGVFDETYEEVA